MRLLILNRILKSQLYYHALPSVDTNEIDLDTFNNIYLLILKLIFKIPKFIPKELVGICIDNKDFIAYYKKTKTKSFLLRNLSVYNYDITDNISLLKEWFFISINSFPGDFYKKRR
jgi:hypothetical protein